MRLLLSTSIILLLAFFSGCKKSDPPPKLSSDKRITSIRFESSDNGTVQTSNFTVKISNDSVYVKVPLGTVITGLVPTVEFKGASVLPASKTAQNFTTPVRYTVTAADGSVRVYTVVVSIASSTKSITRFVFTAAANSGLSADVTGVIGSDTIVLAVPVGTNLGALVPLIEHNGVSISPVSNLTQSFNSPVRYTVTAEDGSVKEYVVVAGVNATVFIGTADGTLYALNATTGNIKWTYNTHSAVSGNTFFNGVVYAMCQDGNVYAINENGTLKWTFSVGGPTTFSVASVHYGNVYFYYANAGRHHYCALDEATGNVVWQKSTGGGIGPSKPTIANQRMYYGSDGGEVALNALTGDFIWFHDAGLTFVNPAVAGGKVYTSTEGTILSSLDENTGTLNWSFTEPGRSQVSTAPTIYNNIAVVGCTVGLYALNISDGSVKWKFDGGYFASPVIANDLVYTSYGNLYAIDVNTGVPKWSRAIPTGNMVFANNQLFGGAFTSLYMLDARGGTIKWTFTTNADITSDPCVIDNNGQVYYSGDSGDQN